MRAESGRFHVGREQVEEVKALGRASVTQASNTMIVQLARMVLLTAGALGGFSVSRLADWSAQSGLSPQLVIFVFIILGASMGYLLGSIIGRELTEQYRRIEQQIQDFDTTDLLLAAVGLVIGLVIAFLISTPLKLLRPTWLGFLAIVLVYGLTGYGSTQLFMTKRSDVHRRFGGMLDGPPGQPPDSLKFLDTSAVIDGRFQQLVEAGLLEGKVAVPRFVLVELQTLADSADELRRARGRRGLDLLTTLSTGPDALQVFEADYPEIPGVDAKLVRLASASGGAIVTVDHNLTQVARVEGVRVLNVNEVASAVRPLFIPGDTIRISIVKDGKEPTQGVGYLEDGTMVVVADGKQAVGSERSVGVTSVLQTSAGRMIFAKLAES
ncbi:MAG: PIN/TRAM domain-containing protein [Actinomycetia bacterium]|nr:PIN/TRAM domain-containing protein [Actinomycetes bacterium]